MQKFNVEGREIYSCPKMDSLPSQREIIIDNIKEGRNIIITPNYGMRLLQEES